MDFKHLNLHDFPDLKATTTKEGRRYQVDGAFYPSVTTVIGHSKKKSIMEWRKKVGEEDANRISKRASTRGNKCHKLCELYLLNQNMLKKTDKIKKIEYDPDLKVVIVRTSRKTNYEEKLKRKITTSGCAVGTVFGDVYDEILKSKIKSKKKIKHSWIYEISKKINLTPSLYLEAGAIHGCAIIENNNPIIYMEDVGRHNAVDKIAGYMFLNKIDGNNKIFYTTGRLTSEMVIKTVKMMLPILISRSGFTSWGVELAKKTNLTLIGRAKGKKHIILSGKHRIKY